MKSAAPTAERRLLTDEDAARYTGTSRAYVRALVERGVLKRVELPTADGTPGRARLLRLDLRDLDAWLDGLPRA